MDWNEEWNASIKATSRYQLNSGSFWDGHANSNGSSSFSEAMTGDQVALIRPDPQQRVLEIGPGNGRLTMPLARSSSEITIVDPSAMMLRAVRTLAESEGLANLKLINEYWENVDVGALGMYHKLVSSYSLFMYDVGEQMRRMSSISDEVFLFVPADIRIPFDVQEILFGQVAVEHTDYKILSHIAREMGMAPRTLIWEYPNGPGFDSLEAAVKHCCDMYNATGSIGKKVAEHLSSTMMEKDGRFFANASRKVGVICWQNE